MSDTPDTTKPATVNESQSSGPADAIESKSIRLSVNMNAETAAALKDLAENGKVSVTEAVRRAIAIAQYFAEETAAGNQILIENPKSGRVRELVLM